MTAHTLNPWSQVVRLHPDVESGNTAVATYAIDLGALVAGDPQRAPRLPAGSRLLRGHVPHHRPAPAAGGCAGRAGRRAEATGCCSFARPSAAASRTRWPRSITPRGDRSSLDRLPKAPTCPIPARCASPCSTARSSTCKGEQVNGQRVQTMWGLLAAQLGCYDLVSYHDQNRVAPGGDVIAAMLGTEPTLILLDEVLKYLERVLAESVGDSTLGRLTQDFIQSLSIEVARAPARGAGLQPAGQRPRGVRQHGAAGHARPPDLARRRQARAGRRRRDPAGAAPPAAVRAA